MNTSIRYTSSYTKTENCVEVADADQVVLIRDTKDRDGGTTAVSAASWTPFAESSKSTR
ncbi:DUF397 domain-containing protein [Streptomyces bacillaris]|uniref:DUF397 domain-containing protein n=1 Tax=Streptomyces bacillaris TaxID=68179 RepID=UPI003702DA32